jgi:hypothetical protein
MPGDWLDEACPAKSQWLFQQNNQDNCYMVRLPDFLTEQTAIFPEIRVLCVLNGRVQHNTPVINHFQY